MALALGYAAALAIWALLVWRRPQLWPDATPAFARSWVETGWALLGVAGVLAVGQLYGAGIRVPAAGRLRPLLESINQVLIFLPMLLVPVLRRHRAETAWVRVDRVWLRLGVGAVLSMVAVAVFATLYGHGIVDAWAGAYRPGNLHIAVQVLCEDLAIAILVVRLAGAMGKGRAVVLAALLFAAGHIPAMLSNGASGAELLALVRDAGLGAAVIGIGIRAGDVWVLWPIHFGMDMMQFVANGRVP